MLKSKIVSTPRPTVNSSAGRNITLAPQACPHCAYEVRAADAELHDDGDPAEAVMSDDLPAAAIHYATCGGLPVFPCTPRGKTPAVGRGFHAATTNPATIRRYWTDPERNIGIPTGVPSSSLKNSMMVQRITSSSRRSDTHHPMALGHLTRNDTYRLRVASEPHISN